MESSSLQELEQIPGVGITIARDKLLRATKLCLSFLPRQELLASSTGRGCFYTHHDPGLPSEALAKAGTAKMAELQG